MKKPNTPVARAVSALACVALIGAAPAMAADYSGSDEAFNAMVQEMTGRDTGSLWLDYYVETLNAEIAFRADQEPFGAAGPSGPLAGFDGYLAGFVAPDTGSRWFNAYVDSVRHTLRDKEK